MTRRPPATGVEEGGGDVGGRLRTLVAEAARGRGGRRDDREGRVVAEGDGGDTLTHVELG